MAVSKMGGKRANAPRDFSPSAAKIAKIKKDQHLPARFRPHVCKWHVQRQVMWWLMRDRPAQRGGVLVAALPYFVTPVGGSVRIHQLNMWEAGPGRDRRAYKTGGVGKIGIRIEFQCLYVSISTQYKPL